MPSIFVHRDANGEMFFYNLEANVGIKSPNKRGDVELVQLAYHAMSRSKNPRVWPELRAAAAAVIPGAAYTGAVNDPLTKAIILHQKLRGGTQDGHVSVMRGSIGYPSADGGHTFMMVPLVNALREMNTEAFPRLDLFDKCPQELARIVRKLFVPTQ